METLNRATTSGQDIHIKNHGPYLQQAQSVTGVMELGDNLPMIRIFEDDKLNRTFRIEPLAANPHLQGQFWHFSIRIFENDGVMIDGIIAGNPTSTPAWTDSNFEAFRLQAFFLSTSEEKNTALIGKGLFAKGLHFAGNITPTSIRNICICPHCTQSFTLQHIHGGFSEMQYLHSADGSKTLLVHYNEIAGIPPQLANHIDQDLLKQAEAQLPAADTDNFRYYNPLRCPHCKTPFIDFIKFPEIRPQEYYGNKFINDQFYYLKDFAG